ncbi:hypothetical protein NIES4073_49320 [Kalymmatonema gypsitolerans NIES-4073]|nr:hypothetical protein NIES4073_49320 [Scytonema sp. NIES-4073]
MTTKLIAASRKIGFLKSCYDLYSQSVEMIVIKLTISLRFSLALFVNRAKENRNLQVTNRCRYYPQAAQLQCVQTPSITIGLSDSP